MALVQSTLASGLEALEPTDDEAIAVQRIADAFDDYFAGASVNGSPAVPAALAPCKAAMVAAMTGLSTTGGAAAAIQAGILAYWTTLLPLASAVWPATVGPVIPPAVPPAGLAGIAAALAPVFTANTSGGLSLVASAAAVAAALHPLQLGGLVNLGPPPPGGTPSVPIL
jgi:hypothetical protein